MWLLEEKKTKTLQKGPIHWPSTVFKPIASPAIRWLRGSSPTNSLHVHKTVLLTQSWEPCQTDATTNKLDSDRSFDLNTPDAVHPILPVVCDKTFPLYSSLSQGKIALEGTNFQGQNLLLAKRKLSTFFTETTDGVEIHRSTRSTKKKCVAIPSLFCSLMLVFCVILDSVVIGKALIVNSNLDNTRVF